MGLLFFFLLLISAQTTSSINITLGSSLTPTTISNWTSPSGLFAFGFFPQNVNGYAVGVFLYDIVGTVVWTANRDGDPTVPNDVVALQLTNDGRLILRRRQGGSTDVNVINTSQPIASASMLDTGNFVLYGSDSTLIWQSFDHPTNTLVPGQRLHRGEELFSSASETDYGRGIFRLKMQVDGNLVQYPVNTRDTAVYSYYASSTPANNASLNLDSDGRLYILNGGVSLISNITNGGYPTQGFIYFMRLDVGGIFRIYSLSLNPLRNLTERWSSSEDLCIPKGFCGVNAFCDIQMNNAPQCQCLPGFDFVQSGNNTAGCFRSFLAQDCQKVDSRIEYEIRAVNNTIWEDNSYEELDSTTEEECREACLDDCNCEATFFFENGQCRKQKLPLSFGRRSMSISDMVLVRVSTASPSPSLSPDETIKKKEQKNLGILITGVVFMFMGVVAVSISVMCVYWKRREYKKIISSKDREANLVVEEISLRAFTYEDLSKATDDFKQQLGRGASGTVYKGVLPNSQKVVAVKRLEKEVARGEREFQTELKTIGKTHHRNLVKLLGYCLDGANKLLVLEYMSNGSLADILFKHEQRPRWEERVKIARDISRGIMYLHEECEKQIIHCDIKPHNILMDEKWCAKVSDFGLAKLLKQDQTNTSTEIRGTRGYAAPEWFQKQPITVKADVYSFGVMLMEMICCKRGVDWSRGDDEAVLEHWVYKCYAAGEVGKIVGGEMVEEREVEKMVKIGIWCVQYEASLRPTMKEVLLMLEGTVDIPIPPTPNSSIS